MTAVPSRTERFLLREETGRRARSGCALGLAALGALVAAVSVVVFRLEETGPAPPELLRPFAVFLALVLALFGLGLHVRLRPRSYVAVDPSGATVTVVRRGKEERRLPLGEVGPLRHTVETRRVPSGKTTREATFHVARSGPLPELVLLESEDEAKTRRALEARSRAWGVPYVTPRGVERRPEELDLPLHERLGSDEAVTTPLPQRDGAHLSVAWRDEGWDVSTSYRPPTDRVKLLLAALGPIVLIGLFFREPLLDLFRPEAAVPLRVLGGLVVLFAFVPGLVLAARTWRRTSRPPVLRISASGVRFRGKTLPLRSIEDVEEVPGGTCRFVSDAGFLEVDRDFCEPSERPWLHHELRRLVVEVGLRAPLT